MWTSSSPPTRLTRKWCDGFFTSRTQLSYYCSMNQTVLSTTFFPAQAYLAINNLVHAVITEDSDLIVYGCPRVRKGGM